MSEQIQQRSEQQMLSLILSFARQQPLIRAVTMNGSRANPNAPKDRYQDFDIVYFVSALSPFVENRDWLPFFGEPVILQTPDDETLFTPEEDPLRGKYFHYLVQFTDVNRIDFCFALPEMIPQLTADSETVLLLDKDGIIPPLPLQSDRDYWVQKPSAGRFYGCCNELMWVSTYVAKGLARGEVTFARHCLEDYLRSAALTLLGYYVGTKTNFSVSIGKAGKYLPRFLEPEIWQRYLSTFPDIDINRTWQALLEMMELFHQIGTVTAQRLGYPFPEQEYQQVIDYLRRIRDQSL